MCMVAWHSDVAPACMVPDAKLGSIVASYMKRLLKAVQTEPFAISCRTMRGTGQGAGTGTPTWQRTLVGLDIPLACPIHSEYAWFLLMSNMTPMDGCVCWSLRPQVVANFRAVSGLILGQHSCHLCRGRVWGALLAALLHADGANQVGGLPVAEAQPRVVQLRPWARPLSPDVHGGAWEL